MSKLMIERLHLATTLISTYHNEHPLHPPLPFFRLRPRQELHASSRSFLVVLEGEKGSCYQDRVHDPKGRGIVILIALIRHRPHVSNSRHHEYDGDLALGFEKIHFARPVLERSLKAIHLSFLSLVVRIVAYFVVYRLVLLAIQHVYCLQQSLIVAFFSRKERIVRGPQVARVSSISPASTENGGKRPKKNGIFEIGHPCGHFNVSRHYLVTKDSSLSRQFWFERQVEARCHSCFSTFLDVPNWQITKLLKRAILKVRLPVTGALNVFLIRWWFKTFQTSYRARASCLCRVRMALPRMSCRQNVVFYREPRLPCKQMGVVCPR